MSKKVLLIEDHDSLRHVMGAFLSKSYQVVSAKNGLEAMSWLSRGERPDVIVTDVQMPELTGKELLSSIRNSGMMRHIPVVVVSGSCEEQELAEIRRLGASEILPKPFNPMSLRSAIDGVMAVA